MPIRLSGMASGLDTEALVSDLVKAYKTKSEKYVKAQTKVGWKQDAWKTMNSKIYSFYSNISSMRFSSAYNLKKATVSNATKASVTANSNAVVGAQSLNVTSLAKAGYLTGGKIKADEGKASNSTKLSELGFTESEASVSINGKEVKLNGNDTIADMLNKFKGAGVNASFDETNQRIFVSAKESGKDNDFELAAMDSNGSKALKALGLNAGSKATDELYAKYKNYTGKSNADLGSLLAQYNDAAKSAKDVATAESNYAKATGYKNALEAIDAVNTKATDAKATELADNRDRFVAGDGTVYTAGKDKDGTTVYYVEGSETKDEDGNITNGMYLTKTTTPTDVLDDEGNPVLDDKGNPKKEDVVTYSLSTDKVDIDAGRIEVKSADQYLKDNYDISSEELNKYTAGKKTVETFEADVAKETTDATGLTGTYSGYSLSALKASVDAGALVDNATASSELKSARMAANKFMEDNSILASYAKQWEAAEGDATIEGEILADLQGKISFANLDHSGDYNSDAVRINGEDATIYLNGAKFTSTTNNFSINGLDITALGTTISEEDINDEEKAASAAINITTSTDAQGVYDKIKDFLSEYNSLINEITGKYNATSAKGYDPLTDEEKDALSDSEVEKWETKIKDSLLRRDSSLEAVMSAMVGSMNKQFEIDGKKYTLASFGIQTLGFGTAAANEHNAYHIYGDQDDTDVSSKDDLLMKMINSDPDKVTDFFQQLVGGLYSSLASKMSASTLSSAMTVYNDKEMAKEYSSYNTTISQWEDKVSKIEDKYYKQFAAMEKALTELQGKTQSLTGLMG